MWDRDVNAIPPRFAKYLIIDGSWIFWTLDFFSYDCFHTRSHCKFLVWTYRMRFPGVYLLQQNQISWDQYTFQLVSSPREVFMLFMPPVCGLKENLVFF